MSARLRRIVLAAAVLPLVVLVGLRSAWAAYACRVDGEVRAACCCPTSSSSDETSDDGNARITRACCCDVAESSTIASVDGRETERHAAEHGANLLVEPAPLTSPPALPSSRIATFAHHARPPPSSLPTFLVNRSILR